MFYYNSIILIFGALSVSCVANTTRDGRLFTFNAEKEDLEVGLDFSIPFIKIPIKDKMDASAQFGLPGLSFPRININPTALGLGGVLLLITSFLAPAFNEFFSLTHFDRSARVDNEDISLGNAIDISQNLKNYSGGCPQRFACWISQKSKSKDKIKLWKQVIRNDILSKIVNTKSLINATSRGINGFDCEEYKPCPIKEDNLSTLINSLNILRFSKL